MNSKTRIAVVCAVLIVAAGLLWMAAANPRSETTLTYSRFLDQVRTGQVAAVTVIARDSGAVPAICRLRNGDTARTVLPADYRDALEAMQDQRVNIEIRDSAFGPLRVVMNATPFLLLLGVWVFLWIRKFPNGPGRIVPW